MPIELIEFNNRNYLRIQAEGNAALWAREFANRLLQGNGVDIGCNREDWCFPGSEPVDPALDKYDAYDFPDNELDYIHSSHCLEHLRDYVAALDYWHSRLRVGGVLFLYLPNMDYQQYWNPASNRKHMHYLNPAIMQSYFDLRTDMWGKVFVTQGYDLNGSFYVIAEKI